MSHALCHAARRWVPVAALVALLAVTGCASDDGVQRVNRTGAPPTVEADPPHRAPLVVSSAVVTAVGEAAAGEGLVRWERGPVTVAVGGAATPRDVEVLESTLAALAPLSGLELALLPPGSDAAAASIEVVFAPRDEWPSDPEEGAAHVLGVTRATWDGAGHLRRADVSIDSTIGQAARNETIVHEILHALGLGHVTCSTSTVYGGPDGGPGWTVPDLDAALVATWYDPALPTGAPADEVVARLEPVDEGAMCEPQRLESAETAQGTIWCEVGRESQPCTLVDGLGPEPALPLDADRWVVDGVVYDHDPERYEAFTFDGRRLLCEREGADRRPCQFTDGPGPLTDVDAWTDGTLVYEAP